MPPVFATCGLAGGGRDCSNDRTDARASPRNLRSPATLSRMDLIPRGSKGTPGGWEGRGRPHARIPRFSLSSRLFPRSSQFSTGVTEGSVAENRGKVERERGVEPPTFSLGTRPAPVLRPFLQHPTSCIQDISDTPTGPVPPAARRGLLRFATPVLPVSQRYRFVSHLFMLPVLPWKSATTGVPQTSSRGPRHERGVPRPTAAPCAT